ncbi:hypothetical protein ANN_14839 [Periplaneta americana]|uniref:Uncharacterized protein n=1 Tax=Periplaneta americana TaxID=6978 RepID=A0ABQ8SZJ9_PERAM|nr:hypothetical protein ANN_14839 [Periplaneta americana]
MAGLCEGGNEPPGSLKAVIRRSEEKRIEAFEMWIWRRKECVKWTDRIRNEAVLERVGEERMMLKLTRKKELLGSLTEKKLPTEGCTGRNDERKKSSGQIIEDIKI